MKKIFKGAFKGVATVAAGIAIVFLGIEAHDNKEQLKETKVVGGILGFGKKVVDTVKRAWSAGKEAADGENKEA